MAIGDILGESVTGMLSGTLGIFLIVLIVVFGISIGFGLWYYFWVYRRKFDIFAKIISKRAGKDKVYFDKAAILTDRKNKTSFLKLKKSNIEIELPRFDIFYHTNKGDYVELLRKSDRDIRFLTPPTIDHQYIVKKDGKLYPIAQLIQREIENDLSWMAQRESQNKMIINPESIIFKILQYMPQIISGVLSFMILWMVLRYAPSLLSAMEGFAKTIITNQPPPTEVIGSLIPLLWRIK